MGWIQPVIFLYILKCNKNQKKNKVFLKHTTLICVLFMAAFTPQQQSWVVATDIVWHKPEIFTLYPLTGEVCRFLNSGIDRKETHNQIINNHRLWQVIWRGKMRPRLRMSGAPVWMGWSENAFRWKWQWSWDRKGEKGPAMLRAGAVLFQAVERGWVMAKGLIGEGC